MPDACVARCCIQQASLYTFVYLEYEALSIVSSISSHIGQTLLSLTKSGKTQPLSAQQIEHHASGQTSGRTFAME